MTTEFDVTQGFVFDGAHHLTERHRIGYGNLHGHSWSCRVTLTGARDPKSEWVIDFEQFEEALRKISNCLDHRYHNAIPGLPTPTMENMAVWIAETTWVLLYPQRITSPRISITRVKLSRPTLGETIVYRPDSLGLRPKGNFELQLLGDDFYKPFVKDQKALLKKRIRNLQKELRFIETFEPQR